MASRALFQPPLWRHHGELVLGGGFREDVLKKTHLWTEPTKTDPKKEHHLFFEVESEDDNTPVELYMSRFDVELKDHRQLLQYGEQRASELGIGPEDVISLVEEYRAETDSSRG